MKTNNLSYETAVRLKEAGFSQDRSGDFYHSSKSRPEPSDFVVDTEKIFDHDVFIPSLTELIDACGEIPLYFDNVHNGNGPRLHLMQWRAKTDNRLAPERFPDSPNEYYGKTPEEAVANLYLALHNK